MCLSHVPILLDLLLLKKKYIWKSWLKWFKIILLYYFYLMFLFCMIATAIGKWVYLRTSPFCCQISDVICRWNATSAPRKRSQWRCKMPTSACFCSSDIFKISFRCKMTVKSWKYEFRTLNHNFICNQFYWSLVYILGYYFCKNPVVGPEKPSCVC